MDKRREELEINMEHIFELLDFVRDMRNFDVTWNDIGVEYNRSGRDIRRIYKRLIGGK